MEIRNNLGAWVDHKLQGLRKEGPHDPEFLGAERHTDFDDKFAQFEQSFNNVAEFHNGARVLTNGTRDLSPNTPNVTVPSVGTLTQTAEGCTLQMARGGGLLMGPALYVYDRANQTVTVTQQHKAHAKHPFDGPPTFHAPQTETYTLDLANRQVVDHKFTPEPYPAKLYDNLMRDRSLPKTPVQHTKMMIVDGLAQPLIGSRNFDAAGTEMWADVHLSDQSRVNLNRWFSENWLQEAKS